MELDHLTVPVRDRRAAAKRLAEILDVPWAPQGAAGPFSAVHVSKWLAIDFDEVPPGAQIPVLHYAFRVTDAEFEALLARLQRLGVAYRSGPQPPDDFTTNAWFGGRGVYWTEPEGHVWEALTVSYAHPKSL